MQPITAMGTGGGHEMKLQVDATRWRPQDETGNAFNQSLLWVQALQQVWSAGIIQLLCFDRVIRAVLTHQTLIIYWWCTGDLEGNC